MQKNRSKNRLQKVASGTAR